MTKGRVSNKKMREIAEQRMTQLLAMAYEEASAGHIERARRYVDLSRRISMRTKTPMPKGIRYCEGCLVPLVPGLNSRTRFRNGKITIQCLECGDIRRIPYIREKSANDRKRSD
ncbi:MAG: ribonuclease protein subunit [Candidatus Methanomethylophilaceae archaeon]|nr:ribonuclease protein subunit [Candidatus Methanomethylophilaceae archaeon]